MKLVPLDFENSSYVNMGISRLLAWEASNRLDIAIREGSPAAKVDILSCMRVRDDG